MDGGNRKFDEKSVLKQIFFKLENMNEKKNGIEVFIQCTYAEIIYICFIQLLYFILSSVHTVLKF